MKKNEKLFALKQLFWFFKNWVVLMVLTANHINHDMVVLDHLTHTHHKPIGLYCPIGPSKTCWDTLYILAKFIVFVPYLFYLIKIFKPFIFVNLSFFKCKILYFLAADTFLLLCIFTDFFCTLVKRTRRNVAHHLFAI